MSDKIVDSNSEILKSLDRQQLKQHIVHDSQQRVQFVFEAPVDARNGDPCLVTEYVYINSTETIVISRQERQYRWKSAWDANFTFNPATDYDPDGDGNI